MFNRSRNRVSGRAKPNVKNEEADKKCLLKAIVDIITAVDLHEQYEGDIGKFFDAKDTNFSKNFDYSEFSQFIYELAPNTNDKYILSIFKEIDTNKDSMISKKELLDFIRLKRTFMDENNLRQIANVIKNPKRFEEENRVQQNYEKLGIDADATEKNFREFLDKIEINESSDYFNGCKTILNNKLAALKIAQQFADEVISSGRPFRDPNWGPNKSDPKGMKAIIMDPPFGGHPEEEEVTWCSLHEISPENTPKFISKNAESSDVIQGGLGDCWLIGAMSVVAVNDEYLRGKFDPTPENTNEISDQEAYGMTTGIYPPMFHYLRQYGIFVFRFFKNFDWKYVIIDDTLPCFTSSYKPPELIFAKCYEKDEFWLPLIEKGYAKLHGTYQMLQSGQLDDALNDFTGLVTEKLIVINNGKFNGQISEGNSEEEQINNFWKRISRLSREKTMMGCSITGSIEGEVIIDGERTGLISGHAYSIQDTFEITDRKGKNVRLLRIRNPWGKAQPVEWNGAWSDGSEELFNNIDTINNKIKELNGKEAEIIQMNNADDGTFLMSFADYITYWNRMSICYNFPVEYTGIRYDTAWDSTNAGGTPVNGTPEQIKGWLTNQQFSVELNRTDGKSTHVFISLGQEDGRLYPRGDNSFPFNDYIHPVVLLVLRLDGDKINQFDGSKIVKMSPIKEYREISLNLKLPNGKYAIVPSTQTMKQTGRFVLSIYYNCKKTEFQSKELNYGKTKYNVIEEEEENVKFDNAFKQILKVKAASVIYDGHE